MTHKKETKRDVRRVSWRSGVMNLTCQKVVPAVRSGGAGCGVRM